jgi:hypothetical protein
MAEKRDPWAKFREEDKEILNRGAAKEAALTSPKNAQGIRGLPSNESVQNLDEWLSKADTLIEQIQNLYQLYLNGMERLPPLTHRKQLEDLFSHKINLAAKTSASLKFKSQQLLTKYTTYKDKWDRIHKDLESGKLLIKRK